MDTYAWIMVMCDADMAHLREGVSKETDESFTLEDAINDYAGYLLSALGGKP